MAEGQAKHQLLLELGRGGMGTVYLAVSRGPAGFSKLKVVKRLRADLASDEQFLQMFLDEARLTARLNHPNVVQTNEVGFDGSYYFIEMEYLEGQSFDAVVRRAAKSGGFPIEQSLYVIVHSLAGLHYAHELKDHGGQPLRIIHRDVSPHNVFVTYDGAVKVLDFGIAKAADSSMDTTTGVVKGKATYMSPEHASRGVVDRRADVFAVGVMLWETLTRKRLWAGLSDFEIFLALQKGAPPSPRSVDASVPEALDAICGKALAFDARERFATAKEMQLAIEEVLVAGSGRVGPGSLADRVCELFAERREAIEREIDARLKEIEGRTDTSARTSVGVPVLGMAKGVVETSTGPTKSRSVVVGGEATRAAAPGAMNLAANDEDEPPNRGVTRERTKSAVISDVPAPRRNTRRTTAIVLSSMALVGLAVAGALLRAPLRATASGAPGATTAKPACTTNQECAASSGGKAAICRRDEGRCVALESEDCRVYADPPDVANDETIWLGVMMPTALEMASTYGQNIEACELARRDFARIAGGLPPARPGGPRRPLGLLVCDDMRNPARAAAHLVGDVGAPAVIGFRESQEAIRLITDVFLPKRTLTLVALNTSSLITAVPEPADGPRLVWRTIHSNADSVMPLARLVPDVLEKGLRANGGPPIRVAVLRQNAATGIAFSDRMFGALRFNGKSALGNAGAFSEFVFEASPSFDYASFAQKIVAFAPDVILHSGEEELSAHVFPFVEDHLAKRDRPVYVAATEVGVAAVRFVRQRTAARSRFLALATKAATEVNAKFVMHYNAEFPESPTSRTFAPNTSYDAVYTIAYAIVASGEAHPSGVSIARAFDELMPPGTPVDVGPTHIFETLDLLKRGSRVDLNGSTGSLDWDAKTGEISFDYAIVCVPPAGDETVESGLVYVSSEAKFRGKWECK